MGAILSALEPESADLLEPLVNSLSAELGLAPSARLQPVIREWLESGTVARAITAEGAEIPPATTPATEFDFAACAPALLAHDSALADARRRLVPAMSVQQFWELTAGHLLARATVPDSSHSRMTG